MPVEGRGLSSRQTQDVVRDLEIGNLATPKSVQKLQTALHAKAKAEAGYRFYALYDKISREDILAHAYAQCRSNKGAPGVDGQDFADIEAHGVERWLAELALALREETYRPEPIRRVFIPKANGQTQAAGHLDRAGSGLHDSSDAGAGADLRSRPSTGNLRLPRWAQRPAGRRRGGGAAVPWPSGSRRRRPRGLLREHPPRRPLEVGGASDRGSARAASDQDVAGLPRRRNRRTRTEDADDGGARPPARHSARVAALATAGKSLHAPVRVGVEEARP